MSLIFFMEIMQFSLLNVSSVVFIAEVVILQSYTPKNDTLKNIAIHNISFPYRDTYLFCSVLQYTCFPIYCDSPNDQVCQGLLKFIYWFSRGEMTSLQRIVQDRWHYKRTPLNRIIVIYILINVLYKFYKGGNLYNTLCTSNCIQINTLKKI